MIFHLTDQNLLQNFVINLFKTLTGRKLVTKYLSSECLTKGETLAILALFGNIPLLKYYQLQWLMVDLRLLHIVLLVLLESYLYLWTSYHQCFLKLFYITSRNFWKVAVSSSEIFFYVIFFYRFDTSMISKRFRNYFSCLVDVFNFFPQKRFTIFM